jgi:hypothetical protein
MRRRIVGSTIGILCGAAILLYALFGQDWGAPATGGGQIVLIGFGAGRSGAALVALFQRDPPKGQSDAKRKRKRALEDDTE